jgi:EAL domain-containing protein (putative c-di-GMP-specific phosphodiesterase class I)
VNDRATLDYLAEIGCDHAQGFFIARALPPEALAAFLHARPLPAGESMV